MSTPLRTERRKFITFREVYPGDWRVINNRSGDQLGEIGYYAEWRQFVMYAAEFTFWSHDCLRDVADFTQQLNRERTAGRQEALL